VGVAAEDRSVMRCSLLRDEEQALERLTRAAVEM
jgi:hypothetical protein